jgi:uncharacterized protein (DUF697 family)
MGSNKAFERRVCAQRVRIVATLSGGNSVIEAVDGRAISKTAEAEHIVNNYMGWSVGAGMIPVPLVDLAAIGGVQLKMLDDLSKLYGVKFSSNAAKSVIGALVGSGGSVILGAPAASLMKVIPVIGPLAALLTEPALAAGATYALGKVFIQHFESGGTFLDFNPESVREYYQEQAAANRAGAPKTAATAKP